MERVIEIDGCVEIPENVSLDDFLDKFIDFIEENGWSFGGGTRLIVDGYYTDDTGKKYGRAYPPYDEYAYPAILKYEADNRFRLYFPDFETEIIRTVDEKDEYENENFYASFIGKMFLREHIKKLIKNKSELPRPSSLCKINCKEDERILILKVDIERVSEMETDKYDNQN